MTPGGADYDEWHEGAGPYWVATHPGVRWVKPDDDQPGNWLPTDPNGSSETNIQITLDCGGNPANFDITATSSGGNQHASASFQFACVGC